jgi:hypothetical protein
MPFCTGCGSQVTGRFCESCGAAAPGSAASGPGAAPQAAAARPGAAGAVQPVQASAQVAAAAPKKTSPLVWILVAVGVLILLVVGAVTVGGIFVVNKVRQAGLDPALWEKNPGLAAAKLLAAANPDAEIVSMDEKAGIVVIRDKKDGKTVKMNFADLKRGRITFEGDGDQVSIDAHGSGDTGSLEVKSKDGVARFAAGAAMKLPSWLPAYAGAKDTGGMSATGRDGDSGTYGFKTSDSPSTVVRFYDEALKKAGFTTEPQVESAESAALSAESAGSSLNLGATADDGQTTVTITFNAKARKP